MVFWLCPRKCLINILELLEPLGWGEGGFKIWCPGMGYLGRPLNVVGRKKVSMWSQLELLTRKTQSDLKLKLLNSFLAEQKGDKYNMTATKNKNKTNMKGHWSSWWPGAEQGVEERAKQNMTATVKKKIEWRNLLFFWLRVIHLPVPWPSLHWPYWKLCTESSTPGSLMPEET